MFCISCSRNNPCPGKLELISAYDSIPVLDIPYSEFSNLDSHLTRLFDKNLCELCNYVDFRIPVELNGKNDFLTLSADYGDFTCENCPILIRQRNIIQILINENNDFLIEGDDVSKDSSLIHLTNLLNSDEMENLFSFYKFHFSIQWDQGTDPKIINHAFNAIYNSYMCRIDSLYPKLCDMNTDSIFKIRERNRLLIEVSNGRPIPVPFQDIFKKLLNNQDQPKGERLF